MIAPCGMSMPVKRIPTVCCLVPSNASSRSLLLIDIEPEAACSTSSRRRCHPCLEDRGRGAGATTQHAEGLGSGASVGRGCRDGEVD